MRLGGRSGGRASTAEERTLRFVMHGGCVGAQLTAAAGQWLPGRGARVGVIP